MHRFVSGCKEIRDGFPSVIFVQYTGTLVAADLPKLYFKVVLPKPTGKHENNELHKSNIVLKWNRTALETFVIFGFHMRPLPIHFLFSTKWFLGIAFSLGLVENQSVVD